MGQQENEGDVNSHEIVIKDGLHSYPLPEFGEEGGGDFKGTFTPPTIEEANSHLDSILSSIEKQGGQYLGQVVIGVAYKQEHGRIRLTTDKNPQTFLIVKK